MPALLNPPAIRGRSDGVDLVRGVFALQVLIFAHVIFWASAAGDTAPAWAMWTGRALIWLFQGHAELNPAVLAFIILSGYCIHRNGLRPGKPLTSFGIRRVFRILPVFVLATFVGIALYKVSLSIRPDLASALTGTDKIRALCVIAKLTTVAAIAPIAHPCDFLGNAPLLTVMVGITLYAFYAFVFAFGGELLVYGACLLSIVVGLWIGSQNLQYPSLYNWWQNSSLLAFLPYWWIGAAAVHQTYRSILRLWMPTLLLAWISLTFLSHLESTGILAEVRKPVLAALVAYLVVVVDETHVRANPMSTIGRAAYSIYALHAPVTIALLLWGLNWWLSCVAAIAFSGLVYVILERPLDLYGHKLASGGAMQFQPAEAA
jgi:peptidoglycan/LPS O-acetylase OafA/YrhL